MKILARTRDFYPVIGLDKLNDSALLENNAQFYKDYFKDLITCVWANIDVRLEVQLPLSSSY